MTNKSTAHNIGLAIWRLKCFYETFVQGSTAVILLNFGAKNPPHRQAPNVGRNFMKQITLIFFGILFCITSILGQTKKDCFEIKYLDFFGVENLDTIKWPHSELDQLLKTDFAKYDNRKNRKTNFLVPFIVLQIKDFHPSCSNHFDTSIFRKLKELYFKIRQQDVSSINNKPILTQLELIRQDFYSQVQNDSLLPYMGYTDRKSVV